MFWTRAILWKIIKVLEYLIGMVRYFPARKKIFFVPYLTRPHHLRHTFCTRFCENETNVKVIQSVMGHASIETTMDIYAEVTEMTKKEALDNLSANLDVF